MSRSFLILSYNYCNDMILRGMELNIFLKMTNMETVYCRYFYAHDYIRVLPKQLTSGVFEFFLLVFEKYMDLRMFHKE